MISSSFSSPPGPSELVWPLGASELIERTTPLREGSPIYFVSLSIIWRKRTPLKGKRTPLEAPGTNFSRRVLFLSGWLNFSMVPQGRFFSKIIRQNSFFGALVGSLSFGLRNARSRHRRSNSFYMSVTVTHTVAAIPPHIFRSFFIFEDPT